MVEDTRAVFPSGVLIVVSTVVLFGIDGTVIATAFPLLIVSVLFVVERVSLVVGVFFVASAR